MFTGLVQKLGKVRRVSHGRGLVLEFGFEPWPEPLEKGESVAVNGACLTVADCDERRFTADVLGETQRRTGFSELVPGDIVNLERALRAGDRLGGHVVQGHVDGRGELVEKAPAGRDFRLRFRCPRQIAAGLVLKGSIAVNGVSLTVTELGEESFAVDIIPVTLADTNLGRLRPGGKVNLETDVLGKYAIRAAAAAEPPPQTGGISEEMLFENGFISTL